MELYLSLHSNVDEQLDRAAMSDEPETVRKLNFSLDHAIMVLESWVLKNGGSMIESGGVNAKFLIQGEHLDDLLDILRQFQEASEASVSVGIGAEPSEAEVALKVAQKRGGDPAICLYSPDVAQEAEESSEDEPGPLGIEESNVLEKAEQFGADDVKPQRGEATKVVQGAKQPDALEPSAPSPQDPPSAQSADPNAQQQPQGDQLIQAVGGVLQDVKQQLPALEGLKQSNPKAYKSILEMVQAMIALAQKLTSGAQPQPQQQPVQKSEEDPQFALGIEVESKEHPSVDKETIKQLVRDHLKEKADYYKTEKEELNPSAPIPDDKTLSKTAIPANKKPAAHHHLSLPVGSVEGRKIKVVKPDGTQSWHQVAACQVLGQDGTATSSREVKGE